MIIIKNKKLLLTLSTFLIAFLFTGCFLFNSAPVIESDPVTTAKEGALYTYAVEATDPNGDTLTYSLTVNPAGMNINSTTGVISWTPTEDQIGENEVEIEVADQYRSTTQSFTITVDETLLASIEVLPTSMSIKAGNSKTITSVTAHYDNGASANIAKSSCTYESNQTDVTVANGIISVSTPYTATTATITVHYTKGEITESDTVIVTITSDDEALLTSIVVLPTSMSIKAGTSQTITSITAHYDNDASANIAKSSCTYESNQTDVTVANGIISVSTPYTATTATITVHYTKGEITESDTVIVTITSDDEALLTSIVVLPSSMTILKGNSKTITSITAYYDNDASANIALSSCTYESNKVNVTVANGIISVSTLCAATTATITVHYTEGEITESDTVIVTVPG